MGGWARGRVGGGVVGGGWWLGEMWVLGSFQLFGIALWVFLFIEQGSRAPVATQSYESSEFRFDICKAWNVSELLIARVVLTHVHPLARLLARPRAYHHPPTCWGPPNSLPPNNCQTCF